MSTLAGWRRGAAFAAGAALTVGLLLAAGEAFLRWSPPRDFRRYLGDRSGLTGPFRADDRYGVQYRDWQAFRDDHAERWPAVEAAFASPRAWAMFGSSFVHMHGMLADTTRAALPGRPVFNLGRNELMFVRAAQVELLLQQGMRPERVFFVVLPHEAVPLAEHSLTQVRATADGGIAYAARRPEALAPALDNSRLALLAWVRTGRHEAVPDYPRGRVCHSMHPAVRDDFARLMGHLGDASRLCATPVTVVLIPNHEQIARGAPFGFQDDLTAACRAAGLDVCDVRAPFLAAEDKVTLFIPDKHFSDRGNRLLLGAILAHTGGSEPPARVTHAGGRP